MAPPRGGVVGNTAVGDDYWVTGVGLFSFGEYKVAPRDINDILNVTGISELKNESLVVYPNPSTGVVNFDNPLGEEVEIFSVDGQHVSSTTGTQIDLNPGIYILRIGERTAKVSIR